MCKRLLDNPDDPVSGDCGGDCVACMASCEDPECIQHVRGVIEAMVAAVASEAHDQDAIKLLRFHGFVVLPTVTVVGEDLRLDWPFERLRIDLVGGGRADAHVGRIGGWDTYPISVSDTIRLPSQFSRVSHW